MRFFDVNVFDVNIFEPLFLINSISVLNTKSTLVNTKLTLVNKAVKLHSDITEEKPMSSLLILYLISEQHEIK